MTISSRTKSLQATLRRILPTGRDHVLPDNGHRRNSESGDTLVEVLIALVVLSFAALAMLTAFGAALSSSQEHRNLTNISTAQKSVTQQIIAQLENANPPLYQSCAPVSTYQTTVSFTGLPTGYTAQITGVSYWNTAFTFSSLQAQCVANSPQLITATVTYPSGGSSPVTAVVDNPTPPAPPPAGDADHLFFYTQPGNAVSGANLSPQPVVEVLDNQNNVVTTDLSDVVLTLNATNGATLSSSCTGSEFYGVVTFRNCSVLKATPAGQTYTITATDATLPNPSLTSNPFTVSVGPPSQLIFTQQPGGNPTGGLAFPTQPQVTVEDVGGNVVTTDSSSVNLAITAGTPASGGPGTLSGCSQTEAAGTGVIGFTGCSINTAGTNYTLTATDAEAGGTLTATSGTFTVKVGVAAQLAFTTSPGASTGGVTFGAQPVVAVEDAGGNTVTTATNSITLAINSQPGTGAALACTNTGNLTVAARNGVANTFAGCKITIAGGTQGSYTLKATATGLTTAISSPFTVAGGATQLVFKTSPTASSGGTAFPTQPLVWVEDSSNDLVTNATASITLAINTQPGTGATLSCTNTGGTTFAVTNGIATFAGCKITLGTQGAYTLKATATSLTTAISNSFTVAGTATQVVFTQQPTSSTGGIAFGTQPQVTIEDSVGDVVTGSTTPVTLSITGGTGTSGAALSCTTNPLTPALGIATFAGCAINLASSNNYTLTATQGALTIASNPFTISVGPAYMLAFTAQPGGGANGATWTAQPSASIEDAGGNLITGATNAVSLTIGSQPGTAGNLSCTLNPVSASSGVASFSGCQIVGTAGNYTISASASGLVTATSTPFTLTVGPATQLAFTTQPGGGANAATWTAQPAVTVEDSGGNKVTSSTASVTLAVGSNPGGTLACTGGNTKAAATGVATFAGCKITGTAGSYSLTATATGLSAATSNDFLITFGTASQLVFNTQPGGGSDGAAWGIQPVVDVEDQSGNLVTSSSASITLAIGTNPGGALTCTGGNTLAAANGVATFAGCQITGKLGSYTVTAVANGLTGATSSAFNITIGAASKLAFSAQPGGGVDGAAWTNQPAVTVEDPGGNIVTTATNSITLALGTNPGGALACTGGNTLAATNGVATFAGCQITGKIGTYTLTAAATGLTGTTSNTFAITIGSATQLGFSTQPGGGANGATWTNQPVVKIEDVGGNTVTTATNSIALAIGTNPGGALTCTGGNTLAATNGVANFAGCKITGKAGAYTLTAAATGLPTITSNTFNITFGAASQLVFSTQPGGGANGAAWAAAGQPAITVEDQSGNVVTNSAASITLAIGTNPGGTLACTGGNTKAANAGLATFAGCQIVGKTGSYTLTAAATGLPTITSNAFNITVGAASQLVFSTQPGGGANGAAWAAAGQPAVTVEDSGGNVVTTAANSITLAVGTNPGGTLACTGGNTKAANTGLATFAGCQITGKAGTYTLTAAATGLTGTTSNTFAITFGTASQLAFSAQPGGGANAATWTNQPTVSVEDQSGNVVTNSAASIALAIGTNPGGALTCTGGNTLAATNGVANFAGCKITGKAGAYTLTAAATGLPTITSNTFNITFGAASQLVFSTQPGGGANGAAWAAAGQPAITVEDQSGNVVTNSAASITLAIGTNPGGTLACTGGNTKAANAGLATFAGCQIVGKTGSYTLTAAATGLPTITSNAFNITVGAASQLVFSTQPGGGANGAAWAAAGQPAVTVEDSGGNVVTTAANSITLAVGTNPGGTLACTGGNTKAANTGLATFAGCQITGKAGTYTLTAAATGLTGTTSNTFAITFGTASQLAFSAQPGGGANAATWTNQPTVSVEDQSGNVVTNSAASIALAIGTNPGGALTCTGGNTLAATNGVANFAGCKITGKAGAYTLTAAATGLPTITSNTFNITFGAASQLVFSTQPGGGANGAAWAAAGQPAITVEDQSGNVVTNSAASITLAIGTNPGGTLACTGGNTKAANAGLATFAGCQIVGKTGSYTLTAAATGLPTITSNAFNITVGAASQLVFSTQPGGGVDGAAWAAAGQPAVTVEDSGGNVVTTATNSITLAITTQPGSGATLACTGGNAKAATTGVATFAGCQITGTVGSYTISASATGLTTATGSPFSITIGAATQLGFNPQPGGGANGVAWGTQPSVNVEDVGGNTVTTATNSITLAIGTNPGGALTCTGGNTLAATNGVANFAGCKITGKAGAYTLTAAATGLPTITSNTFNITFGAASQLVFSTQPGGGVDGIAWAAPAQPAITVEDQSGNVVTNSAASISLALGTNPGGAIGCATMPLTPTNGVATFAGCEIVGKTGSYTVTAAATGLPTITSSAFNITIGAASQLAFTAQPGGGVDGTAWTAQPGVTVQDVGGNTVSTTTNITLAIATQPGSGATLACTGGNTKAAAAGVANFTGCQITGTVGSYTLNASASGLTGGTSAPFSITIGGATQLGFSTQPGGGATGVVWTTQPKVSIQDAGGNPVGAGTNSITLAIATQPGTGATLTCSGTGTGGDTFAAVNGVATATGCKITNGTTAGAYTLSAAATGLTTGKSVSFVVYGAATKLAFTTQPGGGTNDTVWTIQPVVSVEDASGDVVANSAASITLAIATKPNGAGTDTLTCGGSGTNGDTFAAVNGVASISGCQITGRNGTYTISATSNPLTTATSAGFTA